jgi:MFS family permease
MTEVDVAAVHRRTLATLVAAQAVGAVGITIGIATASLLARDLSGSEKWAGLAQTAQVLGAAIASYLLARLMSHRGRRVGLVVGYLIGATGALLAVVAGTVSSMPLLLVGATALGATTAANSGSRYAATDLAPESSRGRSLSLVVWATTIGAVAGPNLTGPAGVLAGRLNIPALTGPFAIGAVAMTGAAAVVWVFMRPDPLLTAQQAAGWEDRAGPGTSLGRMVRVLRTQPAVVAAIGGLASGHAVMVAVMVMTPLHMEHGGAALRVIGLVVSVHVLGMFAFAPLVGLATDYWGASRMLVTGGCLLLVAVTVSGRSPEGSSWQIFGGLFLLGLGWSFTTVAASTLISVEVPLEARTDVQGAADLIMGVSAAVAGALAGVIVGTSGFPALNAFGGFLAVGVLVAAWLAGRAHAVPRITEV